MVSAAVSISTSLDVLIFSAASRSACERPQRYRNLETDPPLEFDDAPRQPAGRPAKVRILDDRTIIEESNLLEIQLVERIEEIRPKLKSSPFGNRELLHQA